MGAHHCTLPRPRAPEVFIYFFIFYFFSFFFGHIWVALVVTVAEQGQISEFWTAFEEQGSFGHNVVRVVDLSIFPSMYYGQDRSSA